MAERADLAEAAPCLRLDDLQRGRLRAGGARRGVVGHRRHRGGGVEPEEQLHGEEQEDEEHDHASRRGQQTRAPVARLGGVTSFADLGHLVPGVGLGVLPDGLEAHPHQRPDARHDQHRDGGGDDALAPVASGSRRRQRPPGDEPDVGAPQRVVHVHVLSRHVVAHVVEKRRSASMKGTASRTAPGTRVATVTGTQTCWVCRSICSISSRWTSRRIARASSATSRPRSPASRLSASTPTRRVEGVDLGDRRPLAERLDLGEALADPPAHDREVLGAGAGAPRGQAVEGGAERVAGAEAACRAARSRRGARGRSGASSRSDCRRQLLLDHEEGQRGRPEHEEERRAPAGAGWRRRARRPAAEAASGPAELAHAERGGVERGVDPPQAHRELLADAEQRGEPLPDLPGERADDLPERRHREQPAVGRPTSAGRPGRRGAAGRRAADGGTSAARTSTSVQPMHRSTDEAAEQPRHRTPAPPRAGA